MNFPEISRSMLKNSLVLGLFAVATVGGVTLVQLATAKQIEVAQQQAQMRTLAEILPTDSYDNNLLDNRIEVLDPLLLGSKLPQSAYIALKDHQASAVILQTTAPDGYSGKIRLLVGIRADGQLAGVRALSHRETPGLGDRVELTKSNWILGFNGKSLSDPGEAGWAVKKDRGEFDQFAGATITPRAVVKAVHNALLYFDRHRAELLAASNTDAARDTALRHETEANPEVTHSPADSAAGSAGDSSAPVDRGTAP
ncbi:electron transport complex subunit RsxG [Pseudomonas sp. SA3-5]|uniref:Ion-translocating oxidoreductase complex subunit G n=1 Tax=Pseudomonas aestuarii TaxID=3018340 RepID=A0ABT4XKC0_9PSED|nr:electron transport complex subunit RsxG [Pseudomonas aestuarii]MDA7088675.1 electron transport complex subunit RsxG [Pseudomonas aestuarii]